MYNTQCSASSDDCLLKRAKKKRKYGQNQFTYPIRIASASASKIVHHARGTHYYYGSSIICSCRHRRHFIVVELLLLFSVRFVHRGKTALILLKTYIPSRTSGYIFWGVAPFPQIFSQFKSYRSIP